jgi:hypothetical protein
VAKKGRPAPTESYIRALAARLETDFSAQDEQIKIMRDVRLMENPVPIHPDLAGDVYVEVRDPTIADEIARVHATLTLNWPVCEVVPGSRSDQAMDNATLREDWTEEVLREAGTSEFGVDTFRAWMDGSIGDGGGWCKLLHVKDTWEERYKLRIKDFKDDLDDDGEVKTTAESKFNEAVEDAKRAAGVPFAWRQVDVATIYPVWSGTNLIRMVEKSQRRVEDLNGQYGVGMDAEGRLVANMGPPLSETEGHKFGTSVTFIEYWDDEWVTYVVEGPVVRGHRSNALTVNQFRHGYGRVPYFFCAGLMPNHWRGRKVGWGVSQNKRALVEYRSVLLTLLSIAAARDVATPIAEEREALAAEYQGDDNRPDEIEHLPLNAMVHLPPGVKLNPLFNRPVAQSFQQVLALVNSMIDRVDSPRVASQIGGGVEGAGFAISQILTEAKTKHSPFMLHAEQALKEMTELLWHLVRTKVKETVWVEQSRNDDGKRMHAGWLGVGPDDLKSAARVRWHLDPEQPSAKIIEARYWHERLEATTADWDTAVSAMGQNPDEIRRGLARQRIRNSDWYIKTQDQIALQEIGRGDILEEAMEVAKTGMLPGMQGAAPPGGGPGMMGGANTMVPDMGAMAMAPGGGGALPQNGGGVGPGAVVPAAAGGAGIQRIGP